MRQVTAMVHGHTPNDDRKAAGAQVPGSREAGDGQRNPEGPAAITDIISREMTEAIRSFRRRMYEARLWLHAYYDPTITRAANEEAALKAVREGWTSAKMLSADQIMTLSGSGDPAARPAMFGDAPADPRTVYGAKD